MKMNVNYGYLSSVASGRRPWTPLLRERVMAVLGEVPGQGIVYRQGGLVEGESTCIRERDREMGFSLKGLAEHVGVSYGYMTQVLRGQRNMSPGVQAQVEAALDGPARFEADQRPTVDPRALWDRMEAHQISQNEVARRAGISSAYLSEIMNGRRTPSGEVLAKLHGVLFRPSSADLLVPAEVKVWPGRRVPATAWWCAVPAALVLAAISLAAAPSGLASGCLGGPRWNTHTALGTTAGARCR